MARPATYLTTAAAALLVAAQVVVAPAACCLIRAELFDDAFCCGAAAVAAEPAPPSCCHGPAATDEPSVAHHAPAAPAGECLWCSAGTKIASGDRASLPEPTVAPAFDAVPAAEPAAAAPAFRTFSIAGPFHRTALAACAWLCVWRI